MSKCGKRGIDKDFFPFLYNLTVYHHLLCDNLFYVQSGKFNTLGNEEWYTLNFQIDNNKTKLQKTRKEIPLNRAAKTKEHRLDNPPLRPVQISFFILSSLRKKKIDSIKMIPF